MRNTPGLGRASLPSVPASIAPHIPQIEILAVRAPGMLVHLAWLLLRHVPALCAIADEPLDGHFLAALELLDFLDLAARVGRADRVLVAHCLGERGLAIRAGRGMGDRT